MKHPTAIKILCCLALLAICLLRPVQAASYQPPLTIYDDEDTCLGVTWSSYSSGIAPTISEDSVIYKNNAKSLKSVLADQPGTGSSFFLYDNGVGNPIGIGAYDELRFWFYGNGSARIITIMITDYSAPLYYHIHDDEAGWRYISIDLRDPDAGSVSSLIGAAYIEFAEGNGSAAIYRLDKVQFFDTKAVYLAMGQDDLRNSTIALNEQWYNFTITANETANKITFLGLDGSTFVYQPGSNVSDYQNITSNVFEFITDDEVLNWILTWDGSRLTLSTAPDFELPDPGDLFSANAAKEWFDDRLGIFSYSIVLLIPLGSYLKTKDPGVPAIILLFLAAAGYYLDPSIAPMAELSIVGGAALLLYRIFWSRGK